ncbi:hypothetical protein Taro_050241 [Colocasia esculenta]|uniref:Lipoxygenase n=1 Tax=Colocasia esculenta TaxID=4460 RepID=A0A843XDA5_COLES|nr:hypothetical protein [Colocasia esculenta]
MAGIFHRLVDAVTGAKHETHLKKDAVTAAMIKGTVVLIKSNVLGFNDFKDSLLDGLDELVGNRVYFELVSATVGDPNKGNRGKVGKPASLEQWTTKPLTTLAAGESSFQVTFEWDAALGAPGAVIVKNNHHGEFYLKSLTLEGAPGPKSRLHFDCNSWVYPVKAYNYDRVFFTSDTYLPGEMPEPLKPYRSEELVHLRGDNITRQLKEWDRVYAYDYYNDLGDPDRDPDYARPVLGGSEDHPYPRRGRTGRPPTKAGKWPLRPPSALHCPHSNSASYNCYNQLCVLMHADPKTESRQPVTMSLDVYVPRDERFGHMKMSDFLAYAIKSVSQSLLPALEAAVDTTPFEFDTLQDVMNLYEGGIVLPDSPVFEDVRNKIPFQLIKELIRTDGEHLLKLPLPQVIKENKTAWRTDEEFAREMLAGVNPVVISRLTQFPPVSSLDPSIYGNQNSTITAAHIEKNLDGLTVDEALENNRLFILDHHDAFMPYLSRINSTNNKVYASRTLSFLQEDGTLKPLAIELSLPNGEHKGAVSKVFTPAEHGVEGAIWQLAKAYVTVDDSGYHQLISHWLNTHATMEPFVIATNRQLSVVHPIYKLLSPHYRDTMNINALARQILINGGGILEMTVFPDKYAMEMSSVLYKNWKLTDHALPTDLLKRGVAVPDASSPTKLRLLIEDYPYAVDGLAIWTSIEEWVEQYCAIYYPSDRAVKEDVELQAWWKEVREVGHGDKKEDTWWPNMHSVAELTHTCATIIWVASALHAAVNFGQYPYAGYLPNRPTITRQFMPEPGSREYAELETNPDGFFLKTITSQVQTILGISLIEILSRHSSDEVYLGQRASSEWTSDERALQAFQCFTSKLLAVENMILEMNKDKRLRNRNGPVMMPYTLLYPGTSDFSRVGGLTGRGIPNSVSI